MEDILEFIIEAVFEFFAEGIEAAATSKRIPLIIRIIIMLMISAFCLGLTGVGVYGIIMTEGALAKILLGFVGAVGLLLLVLFQRKWWKALKAK